jgi:hypothetical protein
VRCLTRGRHRRPQIQTRHLPIQQLVIGGVNADWAAGADAMRKLADDE